MRSTGGRRTGVSRVYSRKPVTLPMRHLLPGSVDNGGEHRLQDLALRLLLRHHALEFVRIDLHKLRKHGGPVLENSLGARTSGFFVMAVNPVLEQLLIFGIED